uniref:Protein Shroom4 isoform X1 n=2 Tax=Pogona vitticeps TaxID=103695 RepID=A0ABM5EWG1_9SAUR
MEPPPPPSGQEAPPRGPEPEQQQQQQQQQQEGRLASRLLVSFQYVHVQLAGGAPWGFTLKGGLEHSEPLIVSKVEDGGKAALSQKMRSGDELVNINGTPLYGSRQEALILIKGSYRTLKMILRRRNVPILRPHSWHLAKLSEARTETTAMPCPADAFSLSWHLGCDTSDLSSPWTPLSRHCSTEKSSSLGSMDSLDPPSQTSYYEGSLSPIDQAMFQNKRDSAYSSFSASSTTSDSALRPEENSPAEGHPPGFLPDHRYLQTGSEGSEPASRHSPAALLAPGLRPASSTPANPSSGLAKGAAPPPLPPVRQDSLRACNAPPEATGVDSLHPKGRWTSDSSLCPQGRDPRGPSGQPASAGHAKGSLSAEQYYLLSSHADPHPPPMEKGASSTESLLNEQVGGHPTQSHPPHGMERKEQEGELGPHDMSSSAWKASWPGPLGHRHSAPEHLLAAQLQALHVAPGQEDPRWTVSPLHAEQRGPRTPEPWRDQDQDQGSCASPGHSRPGWGGGSCSPQGRHPGHERPRSASVELGSPSPRQPAGDAAGRDFPAAPSLNAATEGVRDPEGAPSAPRKGGSMQHRSAQMRRRSDRFATNLRHEIQWRKAQLQKAKGSGVLLGGEETVRETEEPPNVSPTPPSPPPPAPAPAPSPPPPPVEARPPGFSLSARRWGSELSIFVGEGNTHNPGRALLAPEPRWRAQEPVPERPPKPLPPAPGRSGRWRWSPEHKLQPHHEGSPATQPEPPSHFPDESGLLPFADRRKFFEETSKPLPSGYTHLRHSRLGGLQAPKAEEQNTFQPVGSEHLAVRRHSMDQAYGLPSPPIYPDFHREALACCQPSARHRGDCDCWQPLPCSCAPREACTYCYGERCPALHQRSLPVPASHCAHHCHPRPAWTRYSDCCCLGTHRRLDEAGPWQARKEFPSDEWEPPAVNRKSSQSMSELAPQKMGFARVSPFWTRFENTEPEWAPFCRTTSTRNLSWDHERPGQAAENPAYEEAGKPPLRERAYSESHLCAEPASAASGKEPQREAPLARLEEARLESPGRAKRKGPPPPRPPPPNWEKYHPRRASHHQLLPSKASPSTPPEDPPAPGQKSDDAARQRSQSLPVEQRWKEAAQPPPPLHAGPSEAPSPGEQGSLHHYCHNAPCRRSPEWSPVATAPSDRSGSSRPTSSLEEEAIPDPQWPKEPHGAATGRTREDDARNLAASQEPEKAFHGAAKERGPLAPAGPSPPFRLNSEELMREVAGQDRSLAGVLSPALGRVTATEVMGDFFSPSDSPAWGEWDRQPHAGGAALPKRQPAPSLSPACEAGTTSPAVGSVSCNPSDSKAKPAGQAKETPESVGISSEEEEELDYDLARKKVQLIESISRKLAVLQEAQRGLQDDMNANTALGREVESHVKGACKSQEYEKFRLFIGDLDKVVNLLLSLSGRLARVENTLGGLDSEAPEEEKLVLLEKKQQLMAQLEDAKELQEHVARRERVVFASVSCRLPSEQLQDYQHFVRMKSALAIQQRQLEDKIKLGEEQLRCLRESLRRGAREY